MTLPFGRSHSILVSLLVSIAVGAVGVVDAGCGSSSAKPQCKTNDDCGSNDACMTGTCLPRVSGRTLAFDVVPSGDQLSAHTEIPAVAVGADRILLVADDAIVADGAVTDDENWSADKAHLVAVTPSLIPGQDDLQLKTDMAKRHFMLTFARGRLQSSTIVWLFPPSGDYLQPPVPIAATLNATMPLVLPRSEALTSVRAILHDSLDNPLQGYMVRAYAGPNVISNAATTDDAGMFQVRFAPESVPSDVNGMIAIHADPPLGLDPVTMSPVPRFETQLVPIATIDVTTNRTHTFRMPAFAQAAPLRFTVQNTSAVGVLGVTVTFRTEIPALPDPALPNGRAIYETTKTSDANGEFEVPLIPGTANAPQNYQVSLAPALDAPYSAACVQSFPVTMVGSGTQPQYSSPVSLGDRVTLLGTVLSADGLPAADVTVMATPVPGSSGCFNAPSTTPVSTTTKRDGSYLMLLDAGAYSLDIDPPLDAPLPRLTQGGDQAVEISTDTTHDIVLPKGEVIEGTLTASDGTLLVSAGIKVFEVLCLAGTCQGPSRIPPVLRAQTRTDAKGVFRVVLATP